MVAGGGDGASRVVGERIDDGGQIFGEAYLRRKMLLSFINFLLSKFVAIRLLNTFLKL